MILWPRIAEVDAKPYAAVVLELGLSRLSPLVTELGGNNRGPEVDLYQRALGLEMPVDVAGKPKRPGWPWCTCGAFCAFREGARQKGVVCQFPRTAKAVNVANIMREKPELAACEVTNPRDGTFFVLDHGKLWPKQLLEGVRLTDNGHVGWDVLVTQERLDRLAALGVPVEDLVVGAWATLSANTNARGSREGDRWALHPVPDAGGPETVHGGVLVARFDFDLAPASGRGLALEVDGAAAREDAAHRRNPASRARRRSSHSRSSMSPSRRCRASRSSVKASSR